MADSELLEQNGGPYEKIRHWAEPSIPEAASAMRWVFDNPEAARAMGDKARLSTIHYFSPERCGREMLGRLNQMRFERGEKRNAVYSLRFRLTRNS